MSNMKKPQSKLWFNNSILAVLLLSFSSSLPLVLLGSTLQAWYTVAGVNLLTIGMLTLVGQPYLYKFLWAPLMDRFTPLLADRRRGWILITQVGLIIGLCVMAYMTPQTHPWSLAIVALIVAFISASQDIAIDGYRVDILTPEMRSAGAAVTSFGGRLAILVGGAFALILASSIGWRFTFLLMAGIILLEILVTLWSPMPPTTRAIPHTLSEAIKEPVRNIFQREHALAILIFIIIYKLCDAFAFALNTTFLIRGLGFNLAEVGLIYKIDSLCALLLGSVIGGIAMQRLGMFKSLLYFGLLQAVSNLSYVALALVGKSYAVMTMAVFVEYFCSGLSTVAFIVFLMSLCDQRYSAAQYAIFSALMALPRVLSGPEVAYLVEHVGWATFYFITCLLGLPALMLLLWMKDRVNFEWDASLPAASQEATT